MERCPNCGYCKHCGRSDEKPAPPVQPFPWHFSGWRCACGAWVGPYQFHICPAAPGPTWTISSQWESANPSTGTVTVTPNAGSTWLTAGG